ncbi:sporulation protein YqfD [Anopheles sinensis]|uniref:Sporulation protein YqfD n=1 Tax=Anopheles sinensis TaxID=74873 RepID=A0A084WT41_ANOSI|nr:sporulation protein YqfD [Anopheles sinensis]
MNRKWFEPQCGASSGNYGNGNGTSNQPPPPSCCGGDSSVAPWARGVNLTFAGASRLQRGSFADTRVFGFDRKCPFGRISPRRCLIDKRVPRKPLPLGQEGDCVAKEENQLLVPPNSWADTGEYTGRKFKVANITVEALAGAEQRTRLSVSVPGRMLAHTVLAQAPSLALPAVGHYRGQFRFPFVPVRRDRVSRVVSDRVCIVAK